MRKVKKLFPQLFSQGQDCCYIFSPSIKDYRNEYKIISKWFKDLMEYHKKLNRK